MRDAAIRNILQAADSSVMAETGDKPKSVFDVMKKVDMLKSLSDQQLKELAIRADQKKLDNAAKIFGLEDSKNNSQTGMNLNLDEMALGGQGQNLQKILKNLMNGDSIF